MFSQKIIGKKTISRCKNNKSILTKQKISKKTWPLRIRLSRKNTIGIVLISFVVVIVVAALRLFDFSPKQYVLNLKQSLQQKVFRSIATTIPLTTSSWHVEVVTSKDLMISEDTRRDILKISEKHLKLGDLKELEKISSDVEQLGYLDAVRVTRTGLDNLYIAVKKREPLLLVDVGGQIRFVTEDGTVYGHYSLTDHNGPEMSPTATIYGVFDRRSHLALDNSQRLPVSPDESAELADCIEIFRHFKNLGVEVARINFEAYTGYSLKLKDGLDIVIGPKPFDYKLRKLSNILESLKKDGMVASRIELNYEGKAFIKEKKL